MSERTTQDQTQEQPGDEGQMLKAGKSIPHDQPGEDEPEVEGHLPKGGR